MSWESALRAIDEYPHDWFRGFFPERGDDIDDVWSVAVPVGPEFNAWLSIMNNDLQPEGWTVLSLSVIYDHADGQLVVVAICRRITADQLRPPVGGGLLVPQPGPPPNLRPV